MSASAPMPIPVGVQRRLVERAIERTDTDTSAIAQAAVVAVDVALFAIERVRANQSLSTHEGISVHDRQLILL